MRPKWNLFELLSTVDCNWNIAQVQRYTFRFSIQMHYMHFSVCLIYSRYLFFFYIARPSNILIRIFFSIVLFFVSTEKQRMGNIYVHHVCMCVFFFGRMYIFVVGVLLSNGVNCHVCDLCMNVYYFLLYVPYGSWRSVFKVSKSWFVFLYIFFFC